VPHFFPLNKAYTAPLKDSLNLCRRLINTRRHGKDIIFLTNKILNDEDDSNIKKKLNFFNF
jgi:hypothetical protein